MKIVMKEAAERNKYTSSHVENDEYSVGKKQLHNFDRELSEVYLTNALKEYNKIEIKVPGIRIGYGGIKSTTINHIVPCIGVVELNADEKDKLLKGERTEIIRTADELSGLAEMFVKLNSHAVGYARVLVGVKAVINSHLAKAIASNRSFFQEYYDNFDAISSRNREAKRVQLEKAQLIKEIKRIHKEFNQIQQLIADIKLDHTLKSTSMKTLDHSIHVCYNKKQKHACVIDTFGKRISFKYTIGEAKGCLNYHDLKAYIKALNMPLFVIPVAIKPQDGAVRYFSYTDTINIGYDNPIFKTLSSDEQLRYQCSSYIWFKHHLNLHHIDKLVEDATGLACKNADIIASAIVDDVLIDTVSSMISELKRIILPMERKMRDIYHAGLQSDGDHNLIGRGACFKAPWLVSNPEDYFDNTDDIINSNYWNLISSIDNCNDWGIDDDDDIDIEEEFKYEED